MRYVFHPEALDEYTQAVQYYMQLQTETAQAFINVVEDVIFRIRESPMHWPILDGDVRRGLTQKFPYAILYSLEQDYILILAVMHCRRKPGYWKQRQTRKLD